MAEARKFAVLLDIDNVSMDYNAVKGVFEEIAGLGEISYAKFYGFNDRKHKDLENFIFSNSYDATIRMRLKKRNKSQLDQRMYIDVVKMLYTNPAIDAFAIVGGAGDFVPLISEIKSCGKYVAGGFIYDEESEKLCHHALNISAIKPQIKVQPEAVVPKPEEEKKPEEMKKPERGILKELNIDNIDDIASGDFDMEAMLKQLESVVSSYKEDK